MGGCGIAGCTEGRSDAGITIGEIKAFTPGGMRGDVAVVRASAEIRGYPMVVRLPEKCSTRLKHHHCA